MWKKRTLLAPVCLIAGALLASQSASGAEPDSCKLVRMADPGWTDITSTNAITGVLLSALGYEQKVSTLSVPITYVGMQKEQIDVFLGSATVNTVSRRGYSTQCPNVGRLFSQLEFNVDLENQIITDVLEQKIEAKTAALHQLKANPKMLEAWLAGVKTRSGEDGLSAVKKMLGQN